MPKTSTSWLCGLASLVFLVGVGLITAQDQQLAKQRSIEQLLPETTLLFAELKDPGAVIETLQTHPLRERLEALPPVKQAYRSIQYRQFEAVITIVEAQLGMSWQEAVNSLTDGGLYFCLDRQSEGVAILARAESKEKLEHAIATFKNLANQEAKRNGRRGPVESDSYRNVTVYKFDRGGFGALGDWLIVTNNGDLGKGIIDRYLDGGASLAGNETFQDAKMKRSAGLAAWGFADVKALRQAGVAKNLLERHDNPPAELVLGGILEALEELPYATAELKIDHKHLSLALATPFDPTWIDEPREYYFGKDSQGTAPALLQLPNSLLTLSAHRDLSQWWLRAGDLYEENALDELAEADSNLTTLFSGKDFGEDILGAVQPGIRLVVAHQSFAGKMPQPAIKLPSFALEFRLKNPEMRNDFRRTFQSLIGFLNVVGAMNGQPQLDLDIDRRDNLLLVWGEYVPEADDKNSSAAKLNYNFSPAIAFVENRFIVSSTRDLAEQVATLPTESQGLAASERANVVAEADLKLISEALEANRQQLVAQNMLEEGNSKAQAETEVGLFLEILRAFKSASLRVTTAESRLQAVLDLRTSL